MVREVAAQDVLQRWRDVKKYSCLQPQLLAGLGGVVRVEHAADALRQRSGPAPRRM